MPAWTCTFCAFGTALAFFLSSAQACCAVSGESCFAFLSCVFVFPHLSFGKQSKSFSNCTYFPLLSLLPLACTLCLTSLTLVNMQSAMHSLPLSVFALRYCTLTCCFLKEAASLLLSGFVIFRVLCIVTCMGPCLFVSDREYTMTQPLWTPHSTLQFT